MVIREVTLVRILCPQVQGEASRGDLSRSEVSRLQSGPLGFRLSIRVLLGDL